MINYSGSENKYLAMFHANESRAIIIAKKAIIKEIEEINKFILLLNKYESIYFNQLFYNYISNKLSNNLVITIMLYFWILYYFENSCFTRNNYSNFA